MQEVDQHEINTQMNERKKEKTKKNCTLQQREFENEQVI